MEDQNQNNPSPIPAVPPSTPLKGEEYKNTQLSPEDLEDRWLRWKCLVCGFLYEGKEPLQVCPKCGNSDPDKFDDAF